LTEKNGSILKCSDEKCLYKSLRVRAGQEEFNSRIFKVIYKEIQGLKAEKKALEISKK
jgi:hypothetical protein